MNEALLLLRLLIGLVLLAHAAQKTIGWFGGKGLAVMSGAFGSLGLRPGRPFVIIASITEVVAAAAIITGFLTAAGVVLAAATMAVAGFTLSRAAGTLWNAAGGGEYPFFIMTAALVLALAGTGSYSVDALIAEVLPGYAVFANGGITLAAAAAALAALGCLPFLAVLRSSAPRS